MFLRPILYETGLVSLYTVGRRDNVVNCVLVCYRMVKCSNWLGFRELVFSIYKIKEQASALFFSTQTRSRR